MTDLQGQTFGQYEIIDILGEGGMATVYKARQPSMNRFVALKIARVSSSSTDFIDRFKREVKLVAEFTHPHILPVFDGGEFNGMQFVVMQLMTGGTLEKLIRSRVFPLPTITKIFTNIADALHYAHSRGVIHRDMKPANVLLNENQDPYLADFGIAWLGDETRMTKTGTAIGTPAYMAPEQWRGQVVDGRTDIYALGIMLYEALIGETPFKAHTTHEMMYKHLEQVIPSVLMRRDDLPPALEDIIRKATQKSPEDRFETALDFSAALNEAIPKGTMPPGILSSKQVQILSKASDLPKDLEFKLEEHLVQRLKREQVRRGIDLSIPKTVMVVLLGNEWASSAENQTVPVSAEDRAFYDTIALIKRENRPIVPVLANNLQLDITQVLGETFTGTNKPLSLREGPLFETDFEALLAEIQKYLTQTRNVEPRIKSTGRKPEVEAIDPTPARTQPLPTADRPTLVKDGATVGSRPFPTRLLVGGVAVVALAIAIIAFLASRASTSNEQPTVIAAQVTNTASLVATATTTLTATTEVGATAIGAQATEASSLEPTSPPSTVATKLVVTTTPSSVPSVVVVVPNAETSTPNFTSTVKLSSTIDPTATSSVTPTIASTDTPIPSNTPSPTVTLAPTETLVMTDTSVPSITPTRTVLPSTPTPTPTQRGPGYQLIVLRQGMSLTLYFPDQGTLAIDNLYVEVVNDRQERVRRRLADYPSFRGLRFANLPSPVCFHFDEKQGSGNIPLDCPSNNIFIQRLAVIDLTWFNAQDRTLRPIYIMLGDTDLGICAGGTVDSVIPCEIFIPITE